jgi:protein TIF31
MDTISFQALSNQQKAVLMSERVMGIEHPNTIQEYVSSQAGVGL